MRAVVLKKHEKPAIVTLDAARSGLTFWRWSHMTNTHITYNICDTYTPVTEAAVSAAREVT
jgi:hypothetical protein